MMNIKMELMQNKLSLMDNLVKLRKAPESEFDNQKEICRSLRQSVKNLKDEVNLAKYKENHDKSVNPEKKDLRACKFTLKTTYDNIVDCARKLDNIKPENLFNSESGMFMGPAQAFQSLFFSKGVKNKAVKEYDLFLTRLCGSVKDIIINLDNANYTKNYDFDMNFAEYYLNYLSRNSREKKDLDEDIEAMTNLYKKIYKIII